jgi:hypothetical protein
VEGSVLEDRILKPLSNAKRDDSIIRHCAGTIRLEYDGQPSRVFLLHPDNVFDMENDCYWTFDTAQLLRWVHSHVKSEVCSQSD